MCVFRSPAALPPPEPLCFERSVTLYPQQTSSLRSTLDALHRQVAQVLPLLLALTSPLAPRSQQLSPSHRSHTFRRPLSLAFAPHLRRTHDQHTLASTRTQGCGGSAGVAGVRDRGRWEVLGRGHAHHLITPRLYHHFNSTRHHATIRCHYLWYGQRPGSSPERWNTPLSQAPSAFTRKGAGGGGLFCVRYVRYWYM